MPPKVSGKGNGKPSASSFKALDDFLEKSNAAPGEQVGTLVKEE